MIDRDTLNLAEIPYDDGTVHFRYSRYLAADGTRWIRHGLFRAYHRNGQVASVGEYTHGAETGLWREYHENGAIAAQGEYREGKEHGLWHFWTATGEAEQEIKYVDGIDVAGGDSKS